MNAAASAARRPAALPLLSLLLAAALLGGCDTKDAPTGVRPTQPFGQIRFVNAIPDSAQARTVNVTLEGVPLGANVGYGSAAVGAAGSLYAPVSVGERTLAVRKTADTSIHVLDLTLTVEEGKQYSVLGTGLGTDVSPVVLTDDNSAPPEGQAKLRVVHAAPSAGSVDVYVTDTATATDIGPLAPSAASVGYRAASDYVAVPAGPTRIRLTSAGTKDVVLDLTPRTTPALPTLTAGQVRTVVFLDKLGVGAPFTAGVLADR
jgi:hypothetical protein